MKLISFFLIFLIGINITSISIIKCVYENNVSYFTENFCINKSKPKLNCNGKCHISKVIKNTKNLAQKEGSIIQLSIYFLTSKQIVISFPKAIIIFKKYFLTSEKLAFLFLDNFLKPPII